MKKTAALTLAIAMSMTALAAPAAASHNTYECVGQDNGPDDQATVCLTQDGADDDTTDDPNCPEEGDSYDRSNGAEVDVEQGDQDLHAGAEGEESCQHYCGWFSCYETYENGIEVEAWYQDESSFDTTEVNAAWTEDEDGCDTTAEAESDQADAEQEVSLEEETGDGCPAGAPPNPGWGDLYPEPPE